MKLPNAENAVVDIRKLTAYCLNPDHPRGKHKARVFAEVLGLTLADADLLREAIITASLQQEATVGEGDAYGQRYVVDFEMIGKTGRAVVRSTWIMRANEDFARLTSCYVL